MSAAGNMRAAWRTFGLAAVTYANEIRDAGPADAMDLHYMLRTVGKTEFPVPWASARAASASFVHVARAITQAEERERRFLEPVLRALAIAIGDFIDAEQADAVAAWQRQQPDT